MSQHISAVVLYLSWLSCSLLGAWPTAPVAAAEPWLKVSDNQRFLTRADGRVFFYLGDTAWELFHRLNREQATQYLENRAALEFTVIQVVVLAELDGLRDPNPYGHRPLIDDDPTRPDVKDGPDNDYFDHVDFIVRKANALGLTIGMLPTWGDKWNQKWGVGPEIFTPETAEHYGRWLGRRYKDDQIIWILGGDRPIENDLHREIITALARGLRSGDEGRHLMTFHPTGGRGSAEWFHDADWLDFNMRQNGHEVSYTERYHATRRDYDRQPVKPVMDGEPIYEDHPISFNAAQFGHSVASDTRRPLYWDLFSGAFGHTYGHHSVWQMFGEGRKPINNPLMDWSAAIEQPGAVQMRYGRRLLESRPFANRIPDDTILVPSAIPTEIPGAGTKRFVATRDAEGRYAMVYVPTGRKFTIRMDCVAGPRVNAWWYNPRNGEAMAIGDLLTQGQREFISPTPGEDLDWVLVLDDADQGFVPPGGVPQSK